MVVDAGEVFNDDEDGFYWTCLDDTWRPIVKWSDISATKAPPIIQEGPVVSQMVSE